MDFRAESCVWASNFTAISVLTQSAQTIGSLTMSIMAGATLKLQIWDHALPGLVCLIQLDTRAFAGIACGRPDSPFSGIQKMIRFARSRRWPTVFPWKQGSSTPLLEARTNHQRGETPCSASLPDYPGTDLLPPIGKPFKPPFFWRLPVLPQMRSGQ